MKIRTDALGRAEILGDVGDDEQTGAWSAPAPMHVPYDYEETGAWSAPAPMHVPYDYDESGAWSAPAPMRTPYVSGPLPQPQFASMQPRPFRFITFSRKD